MVLREKLSKIQQEIKAPKNLWNSFGNYKYRNAESILEAFKPYEDKYKVLLTLDDEIIQVGERIYVKAIATIYDTESEESLTVSAQAREANNKKGMDDSQITGTASSYARKYALNGLFLLDDTKDADTVEYKNQAKGKPKDDVENTSAENTSAENTSAENVHKNTLKKELERTGVSEKSFFESMQVKGWNDITMDIFMAAMKKFKKTPTKKDDTK